LFVECAQRFGIDATGVEPSDDGIEAARARGVDLVGADLADPLPFESDRFAAVVMNQVIEHLDPTVLPHALNEARRVLTPAAPLFVFAPTRYRLKPWREETHVNLMGPRAVRNALEDAGFNRVRSLAFGAGGLGVRLSPLAYLLPPLPSSSSCMAVAAG
jgi:SAM-dependent methyltransferase